jgi:deazaflavin-dependent oxidoreductase (nitroreductase family)
MAIPRFMRPVVRATVNPVTRRFAGRLPGFGILHYTGRRTGRALSTPLNVFHRDGRYVVALTYGSSAQWVQNVLAAGEATLRTRGRMVRLVNPRLTRDAADQVPAFVGAMLLFLGTDEFLVMNVAPGDC